MKTNTQSPYDQGWSEAIGYVNEELDKVYQFLTTGAVDGVPMDLNLFLHEYSYLWEKGIQ